MPSQPSNKKRTPSPRRESSSNSRRGASPAAPSSSSAVQSAKDALASASKPNSYLSDPNAPQPRSEGTGTGHLSAMILTGEQKKQLFEAVEKQTSLGTTSWKDVYTTLKPLWKKEHDPTEYNPSRLSKTYVFYDNERKRLIKKGNLAKAPHVGFTSQEDAEILKLLRWHGWLTWDEISKLLYAMMKANPKKDREGNPITMEMRDPDGVRSRFNNYLLPHALARKNEAWLKALRDQEAVWKKSDPAFKSKVKDRLPEKAKKYKPEEIITLTHDKPTMNDQVVADHAQPPIDSFEKEVDSHIERLLQAGWSKEDAEVIVENATHAWSLAPDKERKELSYYVQIEREEVEAAEEPAPGQLSQGSGMTELAQATNRMSISPPEKGRSGKGKEKEKDDGNGKKRVAASGSKDSAARGGTGMEPQSPEAAIAPQSPEAATAAQSPEAGMGKQSIRELAPRLPREEGRREVPIQQDRPQSLMLAQEKR
ncbi:hypothetical protein ACMFMF_010100 [Clarireedia jacksonii]